MLNPPGIEDDSSREMHRNHIVSLAKDVFGNPEKALLWLRMPNARLAHRTPLDMLDTEPGARMVESMLWEIDEGIYS